MYIILLFPSYFFLCVSSFFIIPCSFFLLPSYFLLLTSSYFLLLTSSFLLLTSYFLLLTSSFFLLTSYFFLHAGGRVAPGRDSLLRPSVPDTVQQWNDVRVARAHRRRASPDPNRGGEGAAGTVRSNEETRERRGRDDRGIGRDEGARTPPLCVVRVSAV